MFQDFTNDIINKRMDSKQRKETYFKKLTKTILIKENVRRFTSLIFRFTI